MKTENRSASQLDQRLSGFYTALKVKSASILNRWHTAVQTLESAFPIKSELYSASQMEQHGRNLARSHSLAPHSGRNQLLRRLADNEVCIIDACAHLIAATQAGRQVTPAAEWLLDNFYIIEEQIHTAKRHLPKDYSQQLPRLMDGASRGLPRVYELAQDCCGKM